MGISQILNKLLHLDRVKLLLLQEVAILGGEVGELPVGRLQVRRRHGLGHLLLQHRQLEGRLVFVPEIIISLLRNGKTQNIYTGPDYMISIGTGQKLNICADEFTQ